MNARALATNALWALASHVLHRGSLMLGAIFLARTLAAEEFAAYSYFQMTVSMLSTYAAMGLGVTASRHFAELGHAPIGVPPPVGTLLALSMGLASVAFLLILLIPDTWLSAGIAVPQWLIAVGVAVTVAGSVPSGGILGLEQYRSGSIVSLASAICMLGITALAVFLESTLLGMWGIVLSLLVQNLGQMMIIVRAIGWKTITSSCQWSRQTLRSLAGFAAPMLLVSVIAGSGTWIVGRMILAASGELEFSAYSIGLQWFALGSLLPGMVSRVVFPRLIRERTQDSRRTVHVALLMALSIGAAVAATGSLLSSWLIEMYGNLYVDFTLIIPAFLLLALFTAPINTIGNVILANNGQMQWLSITIFSFVILITSLTLFDSKTSWTAIASHSISMTIMLGCAIFVGKRKQLI